MNRHTSKADEKVMRSWITGLSLSLILGGTFWQQRTQPEGVIEREGQAPVVAIQANDPDLQAAEDKARKLLGYFLKEAAKPAGREFAVKVGLPLRGGGMEHVWLAEVELTHGKLRGVLDNKPLGDVRFKQGDLIVVRPREINDWVIYDPARDEMQGGYSIAVLEKRLRRK